MEFILYICSAIRDALRLKAAAQHSSSELGSALALHFNCKWLEELKEAEEVEEVEESEAKCPGNG